MTNLIYALLQVVHNFGAAAVVGGPIAAYWLARGNYPLQRRLAWLVVCGAIVQIGSGIGFGLTSYFLKGHVPELEGVALIALVVKIFCVISSFAVMLGYVIFAKQSTLYRQRNAWFSAAMLGSIAFSAAAFLRWYL